MYIQIVEKFKQICVYFLDKNIRILSEKYRHNYRTRFLMISCVSGSLNNSSSRSEVSSLSSSASCQHQNSFNKEKRRYDSLSSPPLPCMTTQMKILSNTCNANKWGRTVASQLFLEAIASPSTYPCGTWVSG